MWEHNRPLPWPCGLPCVAVPLWPIAGLPAALAVPVAVPVVCPSSDSMIASDAD